MNIKKIYKRFDGKFSKCLGVKCSDSCCNLASLQGIDIFPDEVIYLVKKYSKKLPVKINIKKDSYTGFILKKCTKNNQCLLQNNKPIVCRCYPVKLRLLGFEKHKIEINEKCPMYKKVDENFLSTTQKILRKVSNNWNRNWWKKWRAERCLKRIGK